MRPQHNRPSDARRAAGAPYADHYPASANRLVWLAAPIVMGRLRAIAYDPNLPLPQRLANEREATR